MSKKQKRRVSSGKGSQPIGQVKTEQSVYRPTSGSRHSTAAAEFNPDYTYVKKDLTKIGVLAGSFFIILIALSFFLR